MRGLALHCFRKRWGLPTDTSSLSFCVDGVHFQGCSLPRSLCRRSLVHATTKKYLGAMSPYAANHGNIPMFSGSTQADFLQAT